MESLNIYMDSSKYLSELCKQNTTDKITIDYSKLDCKSKEEIKEALSRIILKRQREVNSVIFGAH